MKIKKLKLGQYLHGYIGIYETIFQVVSAPFHNGKWIKLLIHHTEHPSWKVGEVLDENHFGPSYTKIDAPTITMGAKCTEHHNSYVVGDVVAIKMPGFGRVYGMVLRIGPDIEMITVKSQHPNFPIGSTIKEGNLEGYRFVDELEWSGSND